MSTDRVLMHPAAVFTHNSTPEIINLNNKNKRMKYRFMRINSDCFWSIITYQSGICTVSTNSKEGWSNLNVQVLNSVFPVKNFHFIHSSVHLKTAKREYIK